MSNDDAIQDLKVKRKLKSMDEVMQFSNEPKHKTYHVPPGLLTFIIESVGSFSKKYFGRTFVNYLIKKKYSP